MKSTIVLSFKSLSQAELGEFADTVIKKMALDPQFTPLKPQMITLKTAYDAYQIAAFNAKDGGKSATFEKNNKLEDLIFQLSTIARHVDVLANENEAVVMAAGFKTRKKPESVTELATPTNILAKNVEQKGVVRLSWGVVTGATLYAIEKRVKGTEEWRNGDYRGGQNAQLEGLESNTLVELKVMALHSSGIKSNWSQLVEVLVS
jgi:hypothetical protein